MPVPGAGEVVVAIKACGVSFPALLTVQGRYQELPALPFVPGSEVAGVVAACGPGVAGFKPGDRVFGGAGAGGLAEAAALRAERLTVMPAGMDFNSENGDTHYHSGDQFHIDGATASV